MLDVRWLLCLLPVVCSSSQAEPLNGNFDSFESLYQNAKFNNPKGCRAKYYGLFTDGTKRISKFDKDDVNYLPSQWDKEMRTQMGLRNYREPLTFAQLDRFDGYLQGKGKINVSINSLVRVYREVFPALFPKSDPSKMNEMLREIFPLEEPIRDGGAFFDRKIFWGNLRTVGMGSKAANFFWIGHELTHGVEPKSEGLNQCLVQSYRLRDGRTFTAEQKSLAKFFRGNYEKLRGFDNPLANPTILAYSVHSREAAVRERAALFKKDDEATLNQMRDDILRDVRKKKEEFEEKTPDENLRNDIIQAALLAEDCERRPPEETPKKDPGMDFGSGRNTEWVKTFEACFEAGLNTHARTLLRLLNKYRGVLPDQLEEARADWVSSHTLLAAIKKYYAKEDYAHAALAVWFSLEPSLFSPRSAATMNTVGPKRTNEMRASQLGANPEFAEMAECEPEPDWLFCPAD